MTARYVSETLVDHLSGTAAVVVDVPSGHRALIAAVEADMVLPHPSYRDYAAARLPEHLWATGRYADALSAVYAARGPRAADNARVLSPWVDQATAKLGADHPDTLTSRNNLAGAYQSAGDLGRAIPLYQQTLADRERILGADHPDTLGSRNNLAGAYQSAGDLGRAIPLYQQTLADCERILGADHPDILTTREWIAALEQETDG